MSEKEKKQKNSGKTAETGEETFANSAARTAGPPAHPDSRTNDHFTFLIICSLLLTVASADDLMHIIPVRRWCRLEVATGRRSDCLHVYRPVIKKETVIIKLRELNNIIKTALNYESVKLYRAAPPHKVQLCQQTEGKIRQLSGVYHQGGHAVITDLCINKWAMASEISFQRHVNLIYLLLTLN